MTQFYSRNDVNYKGDVYSIPFPYMKEEEIQVYLDDVLFTDWFFLNDSQIRLRSLPEGVTSDTVVSVRRLTNIDNKVVTYTNNTLLNKENLNLSQDQLLFAVQEIYDNNIQFQINTDEVIETNKQELLEIQEAFEDEVNTKIEMVSSAAEKINQLEEAVDTAVTAANTASEQAEIAINKANETTELVEQFTENIDSKISTNDENMQSVLAETEAVLQEAKDTLYNTLNKSQITNCITEIPQRIKLELNNGVLTLKAGSTVIVPNGSGVFDEVVVKSDVVNDLSSTVAQKAFLFYHFDSGAFNGWYAPNIYSGSGAPSSTQAGSLWFDSINNQFYWKSGSNWVTLDGYSLPLGFGTWDGSKWTAIDQVFNGFGYIGSTVWVDKGVKGLIPNGRNTDGTLNNIEYTTKNVSILLSEATGKNMVGVIDAEYEIIWDGFAIVESETQPLDSEVYKLWYQPSTNIMRWHTDVNSGWRVVKVAVFANYDRTQGVVSNFNAKEPFRAVDYNEALLTGDKQEIISWGMPDYTRGVGLPADTLFQADRNYLLTVVSNTNNMTNYIYVGKTSDNLTEVGYNTGNVATSSITTVPVPKGWYYKVTGSGVNKFVVYPLIGG